MPVIEVDFETYKEIVRRRPDETVSEGEVVRRALGLNNQALPTPAQEVWESEGVRFPVGTRLEHRFRDGRIVEAQITSKGVEVNGVVYSGLSPAGVSVTKHQLNGWLFWFVREDDGRLVAADVLRHR